MSITLGSRRSPVREELRGVVVDGAGDAPSLDAVLVLAVPCRNGDEKTTLISKSVPFSCEIQSFIKKFRTSGRGRLRS